MPAKIEYQNESFTVSGELDFASVMRLWKQSLPLMSQSKTLEFDFGQVSNSNSAGLALMLEWLKYAKQRNKSVRFNNIPAQLHSIIAVSGIENLLA